MLKTLKAVGLAFLIGAIIVTAASAGRPTIRDREAPTPPMSVSAFASSKSSIALVWAPSSDNVGVAGYNAYRGRKQVGRTTSTSYTYKNLLCGSTYKLGVAAYDSAANVSVKTTVYASTLSCSAPLNASPVNTTRPDIAGEPVVGNNVLLSTGTWSGSPSGYSYQWRRCNLAGACANIAGATSAELLVDAADAGSTLVGVVTARNAYGTASATSAATAVVVSPPPTGPPPAPGGWSPLPVSAGPVYYVASDGSDSNPGTLAQPWRTIQNALDTLRPGELARVRAGTYEQNLVMRRAGTPTDPITIENYPGERPVLRPAASSPSYPLRLTTGAAFVRFHGLVIENAVGASIQNVYGAGSSPGAHDYEISGCEIRNARNSSGMFIDNTNYHVYIVGNLVHDNNEAGVQHQGIYIEADDSLVANNVVYHHTQGFGIQVRTDLSTGPTDVVVANNTVSDNSLGGILVEHTAIDTTVVNNISAFNGGAGIRGYYSNEDHPTDPIGTGNQAYHNLLYGNGGYGSVYSDVASIIAFFDNTVANPVFVDAAARNYRVGSVSPAIDDALSAFAPGADYDGVARPQGSGPDLGAFER